MSADLEKRSGWIYYGAIALFVGILAFAILGLVRSSSIVGASPARRADRDLAPKSLADPQSILATGPQPTIAIPPATASAPTPPPSRTYIHPPPVAEAVSPDPGS